MSLTVSPIFDSAGAVVGASKIVRDITERKQAEERFQLAVEGAPSAMIMVDAVRKDGSEVPVEIGLSPIQTSSGTFVISAVTDITERKRAVEAESQARRAAEETNRAKDEFLAMLSHELRNPLSAILGWAAILRSGQMPLERASHALEVIERNARVEAQLVESLLDLSRIAAGKLKLDMERVDLLPVVRGVVDSLRPAADAKGLKLEVAVPPGPIPAIPQLAIMLGDVCL